MLSRMKYRLPSLPPFRIGTAERYDSLGPSSKSHSHFDGANLFKANSLPLFIPPVPWTGGTHSSTGLVGLVILLAPRPGGGFGLANLGRCRFFFGCSSSWRNSSLSSDVSEISIWRKQFGFTDPQNNTAKKATILMETPSASLRGEDELWTILYPYHSRCCLRFVLQLIRMAFMQPAPGSFTT